MRKRRTIFGLVVALVEFVTTLQTADAHETWFVKEGRHAGEHFSMDLTNLLVLLGAALIALSAFAVHRTSLLRSIDACLGKAERWLPRGIQWRIVAGLTGIMCIANSITGVFLAPNFILPGDGLVVLGSVIQLVIGLLLVSQVFLSLAGVLIVAAAIPVAVIYAPRGFLLDYGIEYVALALAFLFVGGGSNSEFAHLPLPIIRVGLGLTLIVLSIHHKLINPDIALTFLDKYQFNFMPLLGFTGFTNLHFVFAAGMAEVVFGLLLFAGIATRLVSAGFAMFLFSTLIILGPVELVGHLPLIGIALLLVCQGSGSERFAPPDVELALDLSPAVRV